jgi:hypothetical protein
LIEEKAFIALLAGLSTITRPGRCDSSDWLKVSVYGKHHWLMNNYSSYRDSNIIPQAAKAAKLPMY